MWPSAPEVVRQPAESDRSTEAHVPVGGELLRHVAGRRGHVDEVRSEVQHHRRLVGAAVDAHAEFVGGRHPTLVRRNPGVGEERHQAVGEADLAIGDPDQRGVPTVAVEEDELACRRRRDASTDVVEHGEQAWWPTATSCPPTRRARWTSCRPAAAATTRRVRRRRARRPARTPDRRSADPCSVAGADRVARRRRGAGRRYCVR